MIVVADSSPLIVLTNIDHLPVLPRLFTTVTIPPAVAAELAQPNRPPSVREFIKNPPAWLSVCAPAHVREIPLIHAGEREAISVALELSADLLLIDDAQGRKSAVQHGLNITGTLGILQRGAEAGLLNLATAFERIKQTDFWISHDLLDVILRAHTQRTPPHQL